MTKASLTFAGLVNAENGFIERTWNYLQDAFIPAVIGNVKIGKKLVNIDVEKELIFCSHRDESRRVEVSADFPWKQEIVTVGEV